MAERKMMMTHAKEDLVAQKQSQNVNEITNRIVYQRRMECDLKIVPYNL
jgi:hypothetical protein